MLATLTGCLVGILLGMRHALEPDHLAAVSTLVTEVPSGKERPRTAGLWLGAFWGLGHTLALLVVGGLLALLQTEMPPRVADVFEFGVSLMLLSLGTRAIVRAAREGQSGPVHEHNHHSHIHTHAGPPGHVHIRRRALALRPLVVGMIHGLAGSGALTALVLANLSSTAARIAYVALFGLGSVVGMAILSGLVGWPLSQLARKPDTARAIFALTGLFSVGFSFVWGWPIANRLFF